MREPHSLSSKAVQVRSADLFIPLAAHVGRAMVVGKDEDDVGAWWWFGGDRGNAAERGNENH